MRKHVYAVLIGATIVCAVSVLSGWQLAGRTPRLDGSSDVAYQESLKRARAGLVGDELERFNRALTRLSLAEIGNPFALLKAPEAELRRIQESLDGLSAAEVIERAEGLPPPSGIGAAVARAADQVRESGGE